MGLAFRKVPCLQIPLRSKINFSGEHSPDPQGCFIIGKCLQSLKCRNLFQYPRSGVIILLGSNYCLTLATYTLFQILSHVM